MKMAKAVYEHMKTWETNKKVETVDFDTFSPRLAKMLEGKYKNEIESAVAWKKFIKEELHEDIE